MKYEVMPIHMQEHRGPVISQIWNHHSQRLRPTSTSIYINLLSSSSKVNDNNVKNNHNCCTSTFKLISTFLPLTHHFPFNQFPIPISVLFVNIGYLLAILPGNPSVASFPANLPASLFLSLSLIHGFQWNWECGVAVCIVLVFQNKQYWEQTWEDETMLTLVVDHVKLETGAICNTFENLRLDGW